MRSRARTCHLGIDVGTASARVALFDASDAALVAEHVEPLRPIRAGGRHELDFRRTWTAIERALSSIEARFTTARRGTAQSPLPDVASIGVATTASTIAALDQRMRPLGYGLQWADHRASAEADAIRATRHPVLSRVLGQVSPEWGLPKLVHLSRTPSARPIAHVVELLDWINFRLTGRLIANAGIREWGWCVDDEGAWPQDLVDRLDLARALALVPVHAVPTGTSIGPVNPEIRSRFPMLSRATVVMGGMDSYMAALGQGVTRSGRMAISVGSSSSIVASVGVGDARGRMYGPMHRILPRGEGYWHGGQSTAGLAVDWVAELLGGDTTALEGSAARLELGSDGLVFRETLLDRRTPNPQSGLAAVWSGLSLSHTAAHVYRSVLEGVAFGVRHASAPLRPSEIVVTGGLVESRLFRTLLAAAFDRPVGLLRHRGAAAFGAAFAGDADRAADLNPVTDWVEPPGRLGAAAAMRRYVALHRLPLSVGAAARR